MKSKRRLACIIIPSFSLQTQRRADTSLCGRLVAIEGHPRALTSGPIRPRRRERTGEKRHTLRESRTTSEATRLPPKRASGRRPVLLECSEECRTLGIVEGMTVVQARAIAPQLITRHLNEALLTKAREELIRELRTISPAVETATGDGGGETGIFFVDFRGLARHYTHHETRHEPPPHNAPGPRVTARQAAGPPPTRETAEEAFLSALCAVVQRLGYQARAGLAANRFVALAVAACHDLPTCVPAGHERAYLAPLPLDILPMSPRLAERLAPLGLHTIGQFAALAPASVEVRYGAEGLAHHRLARGVDPTPPPSCDESIQPRIQIDLDHDIDEISDLLAHVTPALDALLDTMRDRATAAAALLVELSLSKAEPVCIAIHPARPTTELTVLKRLLALECRRLRLPGPVIGITLTISDEVERHMQQMMLFNDPRAERRRLAPVLIELQRSVGEALVGYPVVKRAHRPEESFGVIEHDSRSSRAQIERVPPNGSPPPQLPASTPSASPTPHALLRICHPPQPIEILIDHGEIEAFLLDGIRHPVRARFGPERREGGWWGRPFARDYYQVLTQGAGLFWIYRDRLNRRWFMGGLFD